MSRRSREDPVKKFLLPDNGVYDSTRSLPAVATATKNGSSLRPSHQVPPQERGELSAFTTTARGTSNVINPRALVAPQSINNDPAPPEGVSAGKSLKDVWETSLFGRAPQVSAFPPEKFLSTSTDGKVCIVRYLPERFERCRVQRPELVEEYVEPESLHDDGARLMHPGVRRRIHDMEVNGRQGEQHLRESLRQRSKLYRTCLKNYPHGALGLQDSPYNEGDSTAYSNAEDLRRQHQLATRRSRGGSPPKTTIGDVLRHDH